MSKLDIILANTYVNTLILFLCICLLLRDLVSIPYVLGIAVILIVVNHFTIGTTYKYTVLGIVWILVFYKILFVY